MSLTIPPSQPDRFIAANAKRYVVRCGEWCSDVMTYQQAERRLAVIEATGYCQHSHRIEVDGPVSHPIGRA